MTVDELAERVTDWCDKHRVVPANGQVGTATTVRTLRYYRSVNLLDAPSEGGGKGYTPHHFLQACSVRVLQAEGLPLTRIQSLLFGRNDEELQAILSQAELGSVTHLPEPSPSSTPGAAMPWKTFPIGSDFLLIARHPHHQPTASQLEAIQQILNSHPAPK